MADWDCVFVDPTQQSGIRQQWLCLGCGESVLPASESLLMVRFEGGRTIPGVVHVDCRQGLLDAGTWLDWVVRAELDEKHFKLDKAKAALIGLDGRSSVPATRAPAPAAAPASAAPKRAPQAPLPPAKAG